MLEYIKNKKIILLLILIIFCGIKTNVFKNLAEVIIFSHDKRIVKKYGYCGGESIGYLNNLFDLELNSNNLTSLSISLCNIVNNYSYGLNVFESLYFPWILINCNM